MAAVEERGQLVCVEPCVEPYAPWACANPDCGATTASKRRGPNLEFCSKAKCKALASQAVAVAKEDEKDRRIAELQAQVLRQATEIALLRSQVAASQQRAPPKPASSSSSASAATAKATAAASAGTRRPLAPLSATNMQYLQALVAEQSTTQVPPAKKPKAAVVPAQVSSGNDHAQPQPPAPQRNAAGEFIPHSPLESPPPTR